VCVTDPSIWGRLPCQIANSNHDRYGVTGHASATNLFLNHSASGRARRGRVYSQRMGEMLLVGLDLSPMPGPNRPVNFLGVLHQAVLEELDTVLDQRAAVKVVFGHYPIGPYTTLGLFEPQPHPDASAERRPGWCTSAGGGCCRLWVRVGWWGRATSCAGCFGHCALKPSVLSCARYSLLQPLTCGASFIPVNPNPNLGHKPQTLPSGLLPALLQSTSRAVGVSKSLHELSI